ncbi:putative Intradiol ring-cleavage dioxygenases domain-containing protein [Seiridium unicorne]|uniref:Intradiol ring-cleavage dioxygenases domain-containing protein n=1 Tax=Seiridium unicorne TaxID=138068 RepID=A0ABR2UFR3_9PEZI
MHFSTLLFISAATIVAAHPGHDPNQELHERREFLSKVERSDLSHCAAKMKQRGLEQLGVQRRKATAAKMAKRGILPRAASDINKSHLSDADYDSNTSLDAVFAANSSCVLSPEETVGPYYVAGEAVRVDVTEDEPGIPLTLDLGIFDVDTCEPIANTYVEIWHCNSTGVYSGVPTGANFIAAPENLDTTFLRGLQQSDEAGAVQFDSIFPGHYNGRTNHIHIVVHANATVRENGTVDDSYADHIGQIYFDQDLIDQVETYAPYTNNNESITVNTEDSLLADGLATSDPIVEYVLLGESVDEGILAWISFGVNTTFTSTATAAATYYEGGGVSNS